MRRFIQHSITVTLVFIIPTLFVGGRFAEARDPANRNRLLKGEYAFTSFRSCIQAGQPAFDEEFVLQNPANSRTSALQGTLSYNGDGTGSAVFRFLNVFPQNTAPATLPINGGETACELEYADPKDTRLPYY